jgi:tetratricopeptide (TPR) repeat protein
MESEAPPSAGWYNFLGWLDVNKKRVAIGVGILAVVGLIAGLMVWRTGEREVEAGEALSAVKHNPTEAATSAVAQDYLKVADKYDGTPAGSQALIRAGATFFAVGDYTKAQEIFSRFVNKHNDAPWLGQAQYGLAACLEAQGKNQEAIVKYGDFLKSYSTDPAADQARFSLARLYEKGNQPSQAIDVLTKMTNGVAPFSPVIGEVQERLKAIYAKNPSLVPAPPVRTPPMMSPSILTNITVKPATNLGGTNLVPKAPTAATTSAAPKITIQAPTPSAPAPAAPAK